MAIIVVGGHTRNIGKTSVVAGLIAAMPERQWTAVKVTQFGHNVCSANGESCDCSVPDHAVAFSEERSLSSGTDTARYRAAGAAHSFWVRTRQGQLHEAMPRLRRLLEESENSIVESNSVLRFLRPAVFISVLDPAIQDFKSSALRYLDRADALVLPIGGVVTPGWGGTSPLVMARLPRFWADPPHFCSAELVQFVRERLEQQQEAPLS